VRPKDPSSGDRIERLRSGGGIWIGRAQVYTRTRLSASRGRLGGEFEVALATLRSGSPVWHGRCETRIFVRMDLRRIRRLRNPIRNYAWGSHTAIAELLGDASPSEQPQAELWIGAHPSAPSWVETEEGEIPLDAYIARDPVAVLGAGVAARFGGKLPFLMKILAAERPLSLQAHPNLEQARAGFARENAAGIPLDAPERCYKDANHKPELICALTPFHALCGFRSVAEIAKDFESLAVREIVPSHFGLRRDFGCDALASFVTCLMTLCAARRVAVVAAARDVAAVRGESEPAWFWVDRLAQEYPDDVGALAPLLLNLVELRPGEALFLPAGRLHSYLRGVGVELMSNSDNVLRGGLTKKHVDPEELLAVLNFANGCGGPVASSEPRSSERRYAPPIEEFALSLFEAASEASLDVHPSDRCSIILCLDGWLEMRDLRDDVPIRLVGGESAIIPAVAATVASRGCGVFYRACPGIPATSW
jgi:mannose-6-phosphate isomerase